jgi:hypothetical protein
MKFTREVAGIIFDSCEGHCWYCCKPQIPFGDWEIDHMTPRAQGGTDDLYNLVLACKACNRKKGNRTVEQYRASIVARFLNTLTEATEFMWEFDLPADNPFMQACEELAEIGNRVAHEHITFAGETHNFRRKVDPRFARPVNDANE